MKLEVGAVGELHRPLEDGCSREGGELLAALRAPPDRERGAPEPLPRYAPGPRIPDELEEPVPRGLVEVLYTLGSLHEVLLDLVQPVEVLAPGDPDEPVARPPAGWVLVLDSPLVYQRPPRPQEGRDQAIRVPDKRPGEPPGIVREPDLVIEGREHGQFPVGGHAEVVLSVGRRQ